MKASAILRDFADQTTLHGAPRIIAARTTFSRCIWTLVCLTATLAFIVQITDVVRRYFSYPTKVNIEVDAIPVPFPAVSVCNMRQIDFEVFNTLNHLFIENNNSKSHISSNESQFVRDYMTILAKYQILYGKLYLNSSYKSLFNEVLSRASFAANIREDVISSAAIQLDEFFVTCYLGDERCNMTADFTTFFDAYYYNCFTYEAPPISVENKGKWHGLSEDLQQPQDIESGWSAVVLSGNGMVNVTDELHIIPGLDEPRSVVASAGEGVRVVIHPPNTQPFPFVEGYDVPPGFSASFSIHPRFIARLGPPYGNCSGAIPFEKKPTLNKFPLDRRDITNGTDRQPGFDYRLISCQRMCAQSHVIAACDCYDNSLPILPEMRRQRRTSSSKSLEDASDQDGESTVKPCRLNDELADSCMDNGTEDCLEALLAVYERISCSQRTRHMVARNKTLLAQCGCHPPCEEVVYEVSYSLAKWPASGFEGERTYFDILETEKFQERLGRSIPEREEFLFNYFDDTNRHETMKNFARLNVYIADSNVVVTRETPDFEFSQLVSDIGGQLGVWVGMSVVTLSEVVELIYLLLYHFLSSRRRQQRHSYDPPMTIDESLTSSRTSHFDDGDDKNQLSRPTVEHQI